MTWTDERVTALKRMYSEGLSASHIAAQLGGVSSNAVIGKVHRLNLTGRARPASPQRSSIPRRPSRGNRSNHGGLALKIARGTLGKKPTMVPRPFAPRAIEDMVEPNSMAVGLLDLKASMCRWPTNDPPRGEPFHFCGHKRFGTYSYCEYHARLAYIPVRERRAA